MPIESLDNIKYDEVNRKIDSLVKDIRKIGDHLRTNKQIKDNSHNLLAR